MRWDSSVSMYWSGGGEDNLLRNLLGEVEFLLRNVMEEGRGSKNGQNCVT